MQENIDQPSGMTDAGFAGSQLLPGARAVLEDHREAHQVGKPQPCRELGEKRPLHTEHALAQTAQD